jgi:hypothetical protein
MAFVLLIVGAFFAFLFVFNGLVQGLRGNVRIGFWATFFAFAATLITVGAVVTSNLGDVSLPMLPPIPQLVLGLGAALAVISIILVLIDSRRSEYRFRDARGLLGIGAGILMVASTFIVPFLSTDVLPVPTVVAVDISSTLAILSTQAANDSAVDAEAVGSPSSSTSATVTSAFTMTPTRTPTSTRTPRPASSVTMTRVRYESPTPTMTPTLPNPCLVLVNYNLNVRAEPNDEASVLIVIPFDTSVPAFAKDESGEWWQVSYEDQSGWVKQEFITLSSACEDLPVRE